MIGQRIVDQRKMRGMTQTQLSENVGISTRTLSKVENGFDIKLSLFLAISDALGADAAELLQLSGSRSALTEANVQEIEQHLQAIKALLQK
ncbi:helix-turn-helix domain-containing protein [Shewanella oncorhynchi]|nr:helix-turn-helix transcriptional regulator [Shewanella baltica]